MFQTKHSLSPEVQLIVPITLDKSISSKNTFEKSFPLGKPLKHFSRRTK